jgi:short-subunit dehydrogenase
MKHSFIPWMEPSAVVEYSIDCLRKGQVVCIPGLINRSVNLLANFIPRNLYYQLADKMERKFRKPQHMPGFAVMRAVDPKPVRRGW